ncbi:MAG: glycosyltransferase family 1 protein [Rhodospirillaceae bacterium]|jgi:hypothetical protein|nr:glycosyltransferase family 1 protein [Rhodospirillaceae bacterium]MBT6137202.1 glycosyltransferase family 1 protein [Rhodospirillaceae bacterium]
MKKNAIIIGIKNWDFGFPYSVSFDFRNEFRAKGIEVLEPGQYVNRDFYETVSENYNILFTLTMNQTFESSNYPWRGKFITWQQDNAFRTTGRFVSNYSDQHWLCADGDGVAHAKLWLNASNPTYHLPHWATKLDGEVRGPNDHGRSFDLRPHDILFVGNVNEDEHRRLSNALNSLKEPYRTFANKVAQRLRDDNTVSLTRIALETEVEMGNEFSETSFGEFQQILSLLDAQFRIEKRIQCFDALRDIPITVVSNDLKTIENHSSEKITSFSNNDFATGLYMMRNAKLLINHLPNYQAGATERLFNAQFRGAAVLSEQNEFLNNQFIDREDIFLFNSNDPVNLRDCVLEIKDSPATLRRVAAAGQAKTTALHTASQRVAKIVELHAPELSLM